jgi:hypothetical protein
MKALRYKQQTAEETALPLLPTSMDRLTVAALVLSSTISALAAPQNMVTLYGLSAEAPAPTMTSRPCGGDDCGGPRSVLPEDIPALVHAGVHLGDEIIGATAIAVDGAGATYYVGVHRYSVIRTAVAPGVIRTSTLPTPTSETSKSGFCLVTS